MPHRKTTKCIDCRQCPVGVYASEKWKKEIGKKKNQIWYQKGQYIFYEGNPVFGMFLVTHGKVKIVTRVSDKKDQIVRLCNEGHILGLHNDGFSNDDKALRHIENLIAQHLGPAHFPCIHSRVITVTARQVLMIACKTSPNPVFLKHEKGEDFYIRTGPASRALATSDALTYIQNRKSG